MKRLGFVFLFLLVLNCAFGTSLTSTLQLTKGVSKTVVKQLKESQVNLGKSVAAKSNIKGSIGEALTNMEYFERLNYSGTWARVSPREIPQGLDHLYISFNKETGFIDDCLIGESKYGSSKLKIEKDGIMQMSQKWRFSALEPVIDSYDAIQKEYSLGNYQIQKPVPDANILEFPISTESYFFKYSGDSKWFLYDAGDVSDIGAQVNDIKIYLEAVADGRITSRNVVVNTILDDDGSFVQKVYKCNDDPKNSKIVSLSSSSEIKLDDKTIRRILSESEGEGFTVYAKVQESFGLSDSQMKTLQETATNKEIIEMVNYKEGSVVPSAVKRLQRKTALESYAKHSLIMVSAASIVDVASQFVKNGCSFDNFNSSELLKVAIRATAITTVYEATNKASKALESRLSKKIAQSALGSVDGITLEPVYAAIDAGLDFVAGYAIDTASIQSQREKGLINKSIAKKLQVRAIIVNGIPSVTQFAVSLIPIVGPTAGQWANGILSIAMEFIVPDYDELSIGVLNDMMKEDPNIIEKWIATRIDVK